MDENGAPEHRDESILGALPRTRPQRSSPRRASAKARQQGQSSADSGASSSTRKQSRSSAKAAQSVKATAGKPTGSAGARKATGTGGARNAGSRNGRGAKTPPPRRREPPAPAQGWEAQEELKTGATVHPPSGVELVESVATIFAELASAVLKGGGRVLKDALSPLRKP